ncbi:HAMP domain-containing sensor histidine kinase [Actinocorallia lasiicapitis]
MTLRARLTLYAGVFAVLACVLASLAFLANTDARTSADRYARALADVMQVVGQIRQGRLPGVLPAKETALQVVDASGKVMVSSPSLAGAPAITPLRPDPADIMSSWDLCGIPRLPGCQRVIGVMLLSTELDHGRIVVVYGVVSRPPWYGTGTALITALAGSACTVVLFCAGTWFIVGSALRPVESIRREMAVITATNLQRRVPVPVPPDEIRALAGTVNDTLERLEDALARSRQFTSDVSHDLRSPIAAMRLSVEETLMYPDDTDWPCTAAKLLNDLERLEDLVTELLILSRLDNRTELEMVRRDLSTLVETELAARTRGKQIKTDLAPHAWVELDRLRMARLVTNLLDNAERHAVTTIVVKVSLDGDEVVLEVCDDGGGVRPQDREKIFERFVRLKESRDRDPGGTGLGLPIALETARAHGGTLTVEDSERGARFVLRLPRK